MSAGQLSRHHSVSSRSQGSSTAVPSTVAAQHRPQLDEIQHSFEPCAATASYFLHAQRNVIFCLHHDTLAVERRFEQHRADVQLIAADNLSENGAGRQVVSYDADQRAIVWDMFTGQEVARFDAYEPIKVATWMRNGYIAFGNTQGHIILFDPRTSEHFSARTIYDPVTALAPALDCKTFAIGYLNGSILIANIDPFHIVSTLNSTGSQPSPITGLAWHGSSSKQKTEMLASQTADGDLKVWSVSKPPSADPARVIRLLGTPSMSDSARSWFGWSKNGRLLQHVDGQTKAWDVRTKKVSYVQIPTVPDVAAICNYGPTATLFTIGANHMIQQYDVNPSNNPTLVANVQHAPVNAPPTPPDSIPRETPPPLEPPTVPISVEISSSEDEGPVMSPLQKMAREVDQEAEERRDRVTPLSPISSRASMSSASSYGRRRKDKSRDRYLSSRGSDKDSEGTVFSSGVSSRSGRDSISIRTTSSVTSSKMQPSSLRQVELRSPEEAKETALMDLFPFTKARLSEVKFRAANYGNQRMTPDVLRQEMLSVVFGWEDDIEELVRDEQARHRPGSASRILLAKWLGDSAADAMAQMVGSESMSSSDWMLLALSSMGQGSQAQIGEAFVRRLLERDEIHQAVAILLGLGQHNDAVEAYVSRKFYIEAVLLTCLLFPNDWQRQSYLVRKWGEAAVGQQQPELAVRCFSCTSIESSEPWFSPRAQEEVYAAQQSLNSPTSPLNSPPSAGNPNRLTVKNAALKLNTNLDSGSTSTSRKTQQPATTLGVTPIIDSAISPIASAATWKRSTSRGLRDPSSARTATPHGYGRKRNTSRHIDEDTPVPGHDSRPGSRNTHKEPGTAIKSRRTGSEGLPSPAPGLYASSRGASRTRGTSKDRNYHGLHVDVPHVEERDDATSPYPGTTSNRGHRSRKSLGSMASQSNASISREDLSPLPTGDSSRSFNRRNIDRYIDSLEEANHQAEQLRAENRSRSRPRTGKDRSPSRSRDEVRVIKPSKRSPSSPVPMSSDDAQQYRNANSASGPVSPVDSRSGRTRSSNRTATSTSRPRASSRNAGPRAENRDPERDEQSHDERGRHQKRISSGARSPPSPSPMEAYNEQTFDPEPRRYRQRSSSRKPSESGRRPSPDRSTRARSTSRQPTRQRLSDEFSDSKPSPAQPPDLNSLRQGRPRALSRKELAAKELEERRLSLARRPSAPTIPHPQTLSGGRPGLSPLGEFGPTLGSQSFAADLEKQRSRTVEPEQMRGHKPSNSSGSMPAIGLPATPRAMRHPRYMSSDPDVRDKVPDVPAVPSQYTSNATSNLTIDNAVTEPDSLGPLLPSSVYGQAGGFRSASAPPEQTHLPIGRPRANSASKSHSRKSSVAQRSPTKVPPPPPPPMHPESMTTDDIIIVPEPEAEATMLPELQHLATPPPPPPPPSRLGNNNPLSSYFPPVAGKEGVINIAIDSRGPTPLEPPAPPASAPPESMERAPTKSPSVGRRGRGSISGLSALTSSDSQGGFSSKWRNVRERMRSTERTKAKSPVYDGASPYETQLPMPSLGAQISPPIQVGDSQGFNGGGHARRTSGGGQEMSTRGSPPRLGMGYRNPMEIKRQIEGGMI